MDTKPWISHWANAKKKKKKANADSLSTFPWDANGAEAQQRLPLSASTSAKLMYYGKAEVA